MTLIVKDANETGQEAPARLGPAHPGGIKRVSVGCGPNHIRRDWWNVDVRPFKGIDEVFDAIQPWPWSGIEYVFAEHFLEHLTLQGAIAFLTHAGQALKPGGKIRLSTPSLEFVVKTHFSFEGGDEARQVMQTMGMNRAFHGWGHQFLYSRPFLKKLLEDLKYDRVEFYPYRTSDDPVLHDLERHKSSQSFKMGFPGAWNVEATRGSDPPCLSAEHLAVYDVNYFRYVKSSAH